MRKIVLMYSNSKSIGCDGCELIEVGDGVTDVQLDEMANDGALEHISSWFDIDDESEEIGEDSIRSEEVYGWWEEYDPEKHDGILS